jgi:methyl-accepting chemotaxis protein
MNGSHPIRKTGMKIRTRFVLANVVIVAVAVAAVAGICLYSFKKELTAKAIASQESRLKTFWELLYQKGHDVRIEGDKLMAGNYVVNGNYELPDRLKELCGGTATIFMGDQRVSTNVLKEDGSRAVGTRLQGPAHDAVFRDGKPYRGKVMILGTPYFAAYDPVRNSRGETIGALYVGVKESDFLALFDRLMILIPALALVIFVAVAMLTRSIVYLFFVPFEDDARHLDVHRGER